MGRSELIRINGIKIKIASAAVIVPLFFFSVNQLILQFFKPVDQSLSIRISFAFQPTIYLLFFAAAVILLFFMNRTLRSMFSFLTKGNDYDKARKSTLAIPWMLILANSGLWLVAITLFYGLQGFKTGGGVPYFWSISTNSVSGFISAVTAALLINRILIPCKIRLKMTGMKKGERDIFVKVKMVLVIFSGFIYSSLILIYAGRYYVLAVSGGLPLLFEKWRFALFYISLYSLLPLLVNTVLAVSEDRTQQKFLREKLSDLIEGEGNLNRKVNLLNFDDTGMLASEINLFIEKIKELVLKVELTGKQVVEISSAIEDFSESLASETGTMLEALSGIGEQMDEQEAEVKLTRESLGGFFGEANKMSDNIEEQSASVEQTSSAIEELAASIDSVKTSAHEVENLTGSLVSYTSEGSTFLHDFIDSISRIESSSADMEEMLEHMDNLSSRVDMLAMNAAIEAAHAGEAGKGFAVVADEVKNLAENSADKSREMAENLTAMKETISFSSQKSGLAEQSFENIRKSIKDASAHFHNIYRAIEEETIGVRELLTTVTSLVSITEDLRVIAGSQRDSNSAMEGRIGNVFSRFSVIKDSINAQKKNRDSISASLEGMKSIAGKNLEIARELRDLLSHFSVGEETPL